MFPVYFISDLEVKLCLQWLVGLDVQNSVMCQGWPVTCSGLFAACPSNSANTMGRWVCVCGGGGGGGGGVIKPVKCFKGKSSIY